VQGDRLVIENGTGRATMAKGPGRVRGVFYPNRDNGSAAAPATPAQPARR
jgi:hypothetical protein